MSDRRPRSRLPLRPLAAIPAVKSELFTLINRLCDAVATQADCTRLESLLADPAMPDAIDVYCAAMEVHASLLWRWHAAPAGFQPIGLQPVGQQRQAVPPAPPQAGAASRRNTAPPRSQQPPNTQGRKPATGSAGERAPADRVLPWFMPAWLTGLDGPAAWAVVLQAAAIAAAILLAIVGQYWHPGQTAAASVACGSIVAIKNALWFSPGRPPQVGDLVMTRERLGLAAGLVEIACDSGATVVLEGPARFELSSPQTASLLSGRLTATVSKAGGGPLAAASATGSLFTVKTPSAVVRDRGTQFGVEVDAAGKTTVHVLEGLVECAGWGFGTAPMAKLTAGEGATVDQRGAVRRLAESSPEPFSRTLSSVADIRWDEARAVTVFRDAFSGTGPLAGTAASSRGGAGDACWTAPAGWRLTDSGLEATSPGSASLPFVPQPGRIYRLAVDLTVTAGQNEWAAFGFSGPPDPASGILHSAWMLQRHSTDLDPNAVFVGADVKSLRCSASDRVTGPRRLAIFLDTTRPRWTVTFVADGRRLKTDIMPEGTRIASVALACQSTARALFSFPVLSYLPSSLPSS
jgi:hypothetical protein